MSYHFPNSITTTFCGLVSRVANKSAASWQLPRLRGSYGETCVMDFGHYCPPHCIWCILSLIMMMMMMIMCALCLDYRTMNGHPEIVVTPSPTEEISAQKLFTNTDQNQLVYAELLSYKE